MPTCILTKNKEVIGYCTEEPYDVLLKLIKDYIIYSYLDEEFVTIENSIFHSNSGLVIKECPVEIFPGADVTGNLRSLMNNDVNKCYFNKNKSYYNFDEFNHYKINVINNIIYDLEMALAINFKQRSQIIPEHKKELVEKIINDFKKITLYYNEMYEIHKEELKRSSNIQSVNTI